MLPELIINFT